MVETEIMDEMEITGATADMMTDTGAMTTGISAIRYVDLTG
jgi:hypothetical protein